MKITLGNHDAISLKKLLQLSDLFELKHPYYSFDHKGVHFVTISTEFAMERGSEQFRFMEKDLRNASSDPKTNWIVVFIHKPTYSSPAAHKGLEILQKLYHGLFQKYNVDLVLQGHNHFYERTYPVIVNTLNYSNPIPTSHVKNSYTNQTGQIFVTVGTGGESLYKYHGEPPFIAAQYEGYGFLNVDVINDTKTTTMEAKFYGDDGNIKDEFSIEKTLGKKIGG
jgi:DNA repair exonuclease SbcCD nuclease subunit